MEGEGGFVPRCIDLSLKLDSYAAVASASHGMEQDQASAVRHGFGRNREQEEAKGF